MCNKNFLLKFFDLINGREWDALEKFLAEDAEFHFPKTKPLLNKGRILKFMALLWKMVPELHFNVQRTIIQGNVAAVHWTNHGRDRKNPSYTNEGVTILEYKDDKITYISDFFKNTENF